MAITGIDTIDGKQIIAAGAVSAKSAEMAYNDENGNPITGYLTAVPEGYATTGDLTAYQTTAGMTAYQSAGEYYSASNPSGFLVADDITGKLDASVYAADSGNFLTAVPDTYLQNTDLTITDGKVTEISGVPLSAGDELPSGVMNTSGLEYNAVNEISGYNGSAIAQYGAEKQWLQHDDTIVHMANSAQYAFGVNVSAVQTLMGMMGPKLEETTLAGYWNGHEVKQMLLTGTFNTNVNSDVIPVNSAYSAYERKWIDPSNSFILYGSSANILPTTWVLGATSRLGSLSLLNGIVRARSNDTTQTNCTAFVTIKWCEI